MQNHFTRKYFCQNNLTQTGFYVLLAGQMNIAQSKWEQQISETEQQMIKKELMLAAYNVSLASRNLGVSYPTIRERMKRYGIKGKKNGRHGRSRNR